MKTIMREALINSAFLDSTLGTHVKEMVAIDSAVYAVSRAEKGLTKLLLSTVVKQLDEMCFEVRSNGLVAVHISEPLLRLWLSTLNEIEAEGLRKAFDVPIHG